MTIDGDETPMSNIWRKEYEDGVEIPMPHRPLLDENGEEVVDDDGYVRFHTVRVRSISADYIFRSGKVPAGLMEVASEVVDQLGLLNVNGRAKKEADEPLDTLETLEKFAEFQKIIIEEMLVYPKLVEKPKKEDEISYEMLSVDDRYFFLALLDTPLADLRRFRRKADPGLEPVPEGEQGEPLAE